jgi:hypothetical protein
MRSFIFCIPPQISLGRPSQVLWGRQGMWHAWKRTENCTRFWWESSKERDHWEGWGVDETMKSEWSFGRLVGVCGVDSIDSGQRPVPSCCECGDEPSGSGTTELVTQLILYICFWFIITQNVTPFCPMFHYLSPSNCKPRKNSKRQASNCFTFHKKLPGQKTHLFFETLLSYTISRSLIKRRFVPTSKVRMSVMLMLSTEGN